MHRKLFEKVLFGRSDQCTRAAYWGCKLEPPVLSSTIATPTLAQLIVKYLFSDADASQTGTSRRGGQQMHGKPCREGKRPHLHD